MLFRSSLPLVLALLVVGVRRGLFAAAHFAQGPIFVGVGLAFIGFFILQGILAHPGEGYAFPIGAFIALAWAIGIELVCRLLAPVVRRRVTRLEE